MAQTDNTTSTTESTAIPERTCSFKVKGIDYLLTVPTNKQFISIETTKVFLSGGAYRSLMRSTTFNNAYALDLIDMIAYISNLCPEMVNNLKVSSIEDLDLLDSIELVEIYRKTIAPWISSWQTKILEYYNKK